MSHVDTFTPKTVIWTFIDNVYLLLFRKTNLWDSQAKCVLRNFRNCTLIGRIFLCVYCLSFSGTPIRQFFFFWALFTTVNCKFLSYYRRIILVTPLYASHQNSRALHRDSFSRWRLLHCDKFYHFCGRRLEFLKWKSGRLCWGVSRSRMTLSSQRLWWRDQEGPWCGGLEGPWCGLWSHCSAWWPKEEVHGNRTAFHLLLVEQIEYALQMKAWWESSINVGFPFKYSQQWNCAASLFPKQNYDVVSPSSTLTCLWEIYIFPGLVCLFCSQICGPILGIYESLTDTWMQELGLRPCNSFSGNT